MASQHYRVSPKYWLNERRRWSDAEKLLGLYLITCEHRNTEGLYRLPKGYICEDLGWPARKASETLQRLVDAGFVLYDEAAQVVLLPTALLVQRPTTQKQVQGALNALARLPHTSLWGPFLAACDAHAPRLAVAIRDGIEKAFESDPPSHPNAHANGYSNGHSDGPADGIEFASEPRARAHFSSSNSISSSVGSTPAEMGARGHAQRDRPAAGGERQEASGA